MKDLCNLLTRGGRVREPSCAVDRNFAYYDVTSVISSIFITRTSTHKIPIQFTKCRTIQTLCQQAINSKPLEAEPAPPRNTQKRSGTRKPANSNINLVEMLCRIIKSRYYQRELIFPPTVLSFPRTRNMMSLLPNARNLSVRE